MLACGKGYEEVVDWWLTTPFKKDKDDEIMVDVNQANKVDKHKIIFDVKNDNLS